MIQLSEREWAVLREMARSLYRNIEDTGAGYWTVGDTLVESEVSLLKKLAGGNVEGLKRALSDCETVTQEQYKKALTEFGIEPDTDEMLAANCWMLMYGPKIVEG